MKRARGFTLVEMLVSLALLALMALMSWRGIESLLKVRERLGGSLEPVLATQTGLLQWAQDLELARESRITPVLDWQAGVLRITRQAPGKQGLAVVAWFVEGGIWKRWLSPPILTRGDLRRYWQMALTHSAPTQPTSSSGAGATAISRANVLDGINSWQVYFYRGNAWVNPQSSAQSNEPNNAQLTAAPLGVRAVLQFNDGKSVVRDTALTLPSAQ